MLRLFLLVALGLAAVQAQFVFNQIDRTSFGSLGNTAEPWRYCHSYCTFSGEYEFMRLWEDADPDFVADTQIFDWSYDGPLGFWTDNCDDIIEFFRYASTGTGTPYTETQLRECRPQWIYIEQIEINYVRSAGQFHWTHHINDAYSPTTSAWSEWASIAYSNQVSPAADIRPGGPYDHFDGLLRYFPDLDGADLTSRFEDDFVYRESYIANYEPNFCSLQFPFKITDTRMWCNGDIIDDSDNVDYPTAQYCDQRGVWGQELNVDYSFGCSDDEDDCDSLRFDSVETKRSVLPQREVEFKPTKTQKLNRATRDWRQVAVRDKRDVALKAKRDASTADIFWKQDDTAGIKFPYCALRD